MKYILFDTDIGGDCDDVMALDVLLSAHKAGECELIGVTYSDRCPAGPGCARAILAQHGCKSIPVGSRPADPEAKGCYAEAVVKAFPEWAAGETPDSIALMRRLLASHDKVTIVATGSIWNIAKLLQSGPDENSPLCGISLVKEKVEEFAVMGGNFSHQNGIKPMPDAIREDGSLKGAGEWNIRLDLEESRYFFENCPVPVTLSPYELGYRMITGKPMREHGERSLPDSLSYTVHGSLSGRDSWDPCTAYYAVYGAAPYMYRTVTGNVTVDDGAVTDFFPGKGLFTILYPAKTDEEIAAAIDAQVMRLFE